MREIAINGIEVTKILDQLKKQLKGEVIEKWGESVLEFDNEFGKGRIRSMAFDWGISLIDYDVSFTEDVKIVVNLSAVRPIEFIFISEGSLTYSNTTTKEPQTFERYQNIVISSDMQSRETYIFPKGEPVKVNFIYVMRNEYKKKKNNNLLAMDEKLLNAFQKNGVATSYEHIGNFSLKIANHIKQLNETPYEGLVRTLSLEGQLNLILALQILEHENHGKKVTIPDSLNKEEIKKIYDLTVYIIDNISEPMTIAFLSKESGLPARKLQTGFNVLFEKSVNEYIRHLKLDISRDYIKNSDKTISEIVYAIGLNSRSYFSRIFFERYGILPMEYRKKVKN